MTSEQWAALAASLKRIAEDIKTNAPLPEAPPLGPLSEIAKAIEADLPVAASFLADHQGELTGVADLLAALAADGVPYVADLRLAILHAPGLLAMAEQYLPMIVGALSIFAPAATGIVGDRTNPWPER